MNYLLQIALDEREDEPTVHERERVVDEEGKTDVEPASVETVLDVFLGDVGGYHVHEVLEVLHELDGETALSDGIEHSLTVQILAHALDLIEYTMYNVHACIN